jgi:oligopeptide transport system ATP-binding protein
VSEATPASEPADVDSALPPAPPPGEPLLEIRGLKKHFPLTQGIVFKRTVGHVRAVDGVDLTLRRGETLGLVGESGCGKSTVSKLLVALEKPTDGTILYKGRDVAKMGGRALKQYRREVQIIFQDPYASLNPRMTVGDIVAEGWAVHRDVAPRKGRLQRTQELLDRVGLNPDFVNRYPHQFSGGQRQRIGIARALALQPEIIVCDEVRHISDRVAVMYLGSVVEEGTDDEVYGSPSHPYTQALLSSVPLHEPHLRGQKDRILLQGDVPSPANPPSGCRFRTRCWKAQEICAVEPPALVDRGQGHPAACHFAEAREVVPVDVD